MRSTRGSATIRAFGTRVLVVTLAVSTWSLAPARPAAAQESDQLTDSPAVSLPEEIFGGSGTKDDPPVNIDAVSVYAAQRGLVGVAVFDRRTGTYDDNGAAAHSPMGSASVIKVLMAEEILHRAAMGQIQLGPTEYASIETMLVDSNDPAASSLYSQFGGVALIMAALTRHGMTESSAPADPQYWGNTKISAHDIAVFYNSMLAGSLPAESREYLLDLLRRTAPVASDGFGQIFGLAGGDPTLNVAVKQGWMCCLDGVRNVHSTAVLGDQNRYIVVILTQYSPDLPWEHGLTTTTELAQLVLDQLEV